MKTLIEKAADKRAKDAAIQKAREITTVAICPVWRDEETNTVVILSALHGKRTQDEVDECFQYMSPAKRLGRMLHEDKELNANILLGKSWRTRREESLAQFARLLAQDVECQVQENEVIGDGDLSHLRAAARLLGKIVRHFEKKGFRLHFNIYGSDSRRSKAYYWLAKRHGAKISNIQGLEDDDPFFQYTTTK